MIFYCCTTTYMIRHDQSAYDDLTKNLRGKEAFIILTNQEIKKGQNIEVTLDTTHWTEIHTILKSRIPWLEDSTIINWSVSTSEINGFRINNEGKAALYGGGAGMLVGAGLSYFLDKKEDYYDTSAILYVPLGGLVGTLLGVFIGPEIGYYEKYIINKTDLIGEEK